MVIGKLRSVVQFKVNVPTAEGAGFEDSWFDYGSTRGCLKPMGGGRNLVTGEIETNASFNLWVRYQPYYDRVDLRIIVDSREFTISGPTQIEDEGKKEFLKFILTQKQNA